MRNFIIYRSYWTYKTYMSRIGKKIIILPEKVSAEMNDGNVLVVKGEKGELKKEIHGFIKVLNKDNALRIESDKSSAGNKMAMWGTIRSEISNMVKGVSEGYEKRLEIEGVGFRAQLQGNNLVLNLGFSHPVEFNAPEGISFKLEKNSIIVSGTDKALVGETASNIRRLKKPEPYKGKGIRYSDEIIRRKAGKKATAVS